MAMGNETGRQRVVHRWPEGPGPRSHSFGAVRTAASQRARTEIRRRRRGRVGNNRGSRFAAQQSFRVLEASDRGALARAQNEAPGSFNFGPHGSGGEVGFDDTGRAQGRNQAVLRHPEPLQHSFDIGQYEKEIRLKVDGRVSRPCGDPVRPAVEKAGEVTELLANV